MFWQNKKNSFFCERLSILDIVRKWLLKRYKEMRNNGKQCQCSKCDKTFHSRSDLQRHDQVSGA